MLQHTIEADCGQHIALHGKPNTFTGNSGLCQFADVSWCCNNAHKRALQWFWCFLPDARNSILVFYNITILQLLYNYYTIQLLYYNITTLLYYNVTSHVQAKHVYRNPWSLPMRWSKLKLQQRSQAGNAIILMFLPNALKLVMCMYVATYNWSRLRPAYCAPWQAKHIYRKLWFMPIRWCKLMLQQRSQAGTAMILMFSAWCSPFNISILQYYYITITIQLLYYTITILQYYNITILQCY